MSRPKRPRVELIQLLAEQRQALAASCENFDKGNQWEAGRLATTIYTLVHDAGSITSLLTQLGLRAGLRFVSTRRRGPAPLHIDASYASPALISFSVGPAGVKCIPKFAAPGETPAAHVQFDTWWTKEPVYSDRSTGEHSGLTRRRLVFALRHQDGGSHVGELTDNLYAKLKAGAGISVRMDDGSRRAMIEAATVTMRQVAWEVVGTLEQLGEVK